MAEFIDGPDRTSLFKFSDAMWASTSFHRQLRAWVKDGAIIELKVCKNMTGVTHDKPTGEPCYYTAHLFCNKCGWSDRNDKCYGIYFEQGVQRDV